MKALLISCFGYYENRTKYWEKVLEERGFQVFHVFSDFDHIRKMKIKNIKEKEIQNVIYISVPEYTRNISLQRLYSHIVFSKKISKLLKDKKPQFVYSLIPPNLLTCILAEYRKKMDKTRLVFDIYDLWPESLPIKNGKGLLGSWAWLRNSSLKSSDYTFLECGYYQKYIGKYLSNKADILYLCQEQYSIERKIEGVLEEIGFCYLGSVNYLINIDSIAKLLFQIQEIKPVHLHLIGTGEGMEKFRSLLHTYNISYTEYGQIYDRVKKDQIFAKCQYGINMYKKETVIGLTMKSLEYFQAGLPVITSNIHDTEKLILKYNAGIIVKESQIEKAGKQIAGIDQINWFKLYKNTLKLYQENFSEELLIGKIKHHLDEILI